VKRESAYKPGSVVSNHSSGRMSPYASSNLPGDDAGHTNAPLFGLAPGGVYLAAACYHRRGVLLPHLFTLTKDHFGGILSAALSVDSRLPGVTWHLALWSPDFPRKPNISAITQPTLAGKYTRHLYHSQSNNSAHLSFSGLQHPMSSVLNCYFSIHNICR